MKTIPLITVLTLSIVLTACDKIQQIIGNESSVNHNNTDDKAIVVTKKDSTKKSTNKRVALLIANQDYQYQNKLRNPINDLNLLKTKLQNLGYIVATLEDATERQMSKAIERFGTDANNADSAIFYFSGHGMQDNATKNYLIPVNAQITSNADIETDGVGVNKIIDSLEKAKPRLSLVLFDACRNNPEDDTRSYYQARGSNTFANKDYETRNKVLISYATQNGYITLDGQGDNSPYALAVANQLGQAEDKSLLQMFDEVTDEVLKQTGDQQNPTRMNKNVRVRTRLFSNPSAIPQATTQNTSDNADRAKPNITAASSTANNNVNKNTDDAKLIPFKKNGKYGYRRNGKEFILPQYDYAVSFSEGLANVKKDNKEGFINKQGEVVIALQYDWALSFSEGLAGVKKDKKWGYINKQGKVVTPLQYDWAFSFSEGLAGVKKDGKWGFINKQGEVVIPLQYGYARSFREGLANVRKDNKPGFINKQGEVVIPLQYGDAGSFSEGLASVRKNNKWGYINKQGEVVIPLQYGDAGSFSEGLASVEKDNKWGFINKQGEVVIPFQYDFSWLFIEGLATVEKDNKYGYINKQGEVVIPLQYDWADSFNEGLAMVKKDGQWFTINNKGERVN